MALAAIDAQRCRTIFNDSPQKPLSSEKLPHAYRDGHRLQYISVSGTSCRVSERIRQRRWRRSAKQARLMECQGDAQYNLTCPRLTGWRSRLKKIEG